MELQFESEDYLYRDLYFGFAYFIGQEVVEFRKKPGWSMIYSGGVVALEYTGDQVLEVYGFLRKALILVNEESLYRGPKLYEDDTYMYRNEVFGAVSNFRGSELIFMNGIMIYKLRYSGGFINYLTIL